MVIQWLRICLSMQGTQIRSLVQENPICCGVTKPEHHNYQAQVPRACALKKRRPHSLQLEKVCMWQQRSSTAKNKWIHK